LLAPAPEKRTYLDNPRRSAGISAPTAALSAPLSLPGNKEDAVSIRFED